MNRRKIATIPLVVAMLMTYTSATAAAEDEPDPETVLRCQQGKAYSGELVRIPQDPRPYTVPLEVPGTGFSWDEGLEINFPTDTYAYLRYDSAAAGHWYFFVWGQLGRLCDTIQDIIDEAKDKIPPP
jgi:hypothetical protein